MKGKGKESQRGSYSVALGVPHFTVCPVIFSLSVHCREALVWLEASGFCCPVDTGPH